MPPGFHNGFHKFFFREDRHFQTLTGLGHAGSVQIGTKADNFAVLSGVGLHALKAGLGILQDTGTLIDHDVSIGGQAAFIPCAILEIGNITVVGLDVSEAQMSLRNYKGFLD